MFNNFSDASGSRPGFRVLREKLRTSLWLLPTLMGSIAVALSTAAASVDAVLADADPAEIAIFVFVRAASDARDVLSSLLTSMITMTSLVFSITMVVLPLAANQFRPRLIRSFMSTRHTQLALGTFVMTSVYCLLQLASVGSSMKNDEMAADRNHDSEMRCRRIPGRIPGFSGHAQTALCKASTSKDCVKLRRRGTSSSHSPSGWKIM